MNKYIFFLFFFFQGVGITTAQIIGCTDPLANNFNVSASNNDGSCIYNSTTINPIQSWVLPSAIKETSGLIYFNNGFWSHNDDSDTNLYKLDILLNNTINYNNFQLSGILNNDWEAISQDSNFIYIGDIGNNLNGNRQDLKIYRIDKNSLINNTPPLIEEIKFSYSLQTNYTPSGSNNTNFDCEAFIVTNNGIYLFTKEWITKKSSIYKIPKIPGTYSASFISDFNVEGLITDATYLEEKNLVVLSGYTPPSLTSKPFLILLYDYYGENFFSGNKRKIDVNLPLHQVEGVTTTDGLNYYISNEQVSYGSFINIPAKLSKLDLSSYLSGYVLSNEDVLIKKNMISLFPNPVNGDYMYLRGVKENSEYKIISLSGDILLKGKVGSSKTIDVKSLSKGIYIITGENFIKKFYK